LQAFAADPQYGLGGQLGFTAVLHTWDQQLCYHVHLHCVIPGGALAFDGSRWLAAPANYLFPVRALSAVFRRNYLTGLHEAFMAERLIFPGRLAALAHAQAFADFLQPLGDKDWVVYSQPPFAGPEKVLEYLSRYTHRVAISNHRLRRLEDGQVTFDYRDRKDGDRLKQRTLVADEFIRRFLTHVVLPRFCRIRHFGFLSNRVKQQRLERCRALLAQAPAAGDATPATAATLLRQWYGVDLGQCPHCGQGRMVVVKHLPGPPQRVQRLLQHSDSS